MTVPGKGGRPLKFKSPEELQAKIDAYFESCYQDQWQQVRDKDGLMQWVPVLDKDGNIMRDLVEPMTVSGLAVALDTSRETLINYENKGEFFDTIKRAKERIQQYAESQLYTNRQTAGVIFSLVNNYGWVNRQEIDHSGSINLSFEDQLKEIVTDED